MTALNTNTARVIDPVLSGIAQGYKHAARVGSRLFPSVDVMARGGQMIEFGKESFINYQARRAPGADTKRIQVGYLGKPFHILGNALDGTVPREHLEDANAVPGIDLGTRATNSVMYAMTLGLEIEQANLANDPNNYPADNKTVLVGGSLWRIADSSPEDDVSEAKDRVRGTCGLNPNVLVISDKGLKVLKRHPKIKEQFKYTTSGSITAEMLAAFFDVEEVVVGSATYTSEASPDKFTDVWGDNAILAYVPRQDRAIEEPSFGYTYTLKGHPFVEQPRYDGDKKSWIYGVNYERTPLIVGAASGFLIQNAFAEPA